MQLRQLLISCLSANEWFLWKAKQHVPLGGFGENLVAQHSSPDFCIVCNFLYSRATLCCYDSFLGKT